MHFAPLPAISPVGVAAAQPVPGVRRQIAVPWEGMVAVRVPEVVVVVVPVHRSFAVAVQPGRPIADRVVDSVWVMGARFRMAMARSPLDRGLARMSVVPLVETTAACLPDGSWSTAITSLLPSAARPAELRALTLEDRIMGALIMAHSATWLRRSGLFSDVRQHVVERRLTMSAHDYVGYLSTVSAYLQLPATQRQQVYDAIAQILPAT